MQSQVQFLELLARNNMDRSHYEDLIPHIQIFSEGKGKPTKKGWALVERPMPDTLQLWFHEEDGEMRFRILRG